MHIVRFSSHGRIKYGIMDDNSIYSVKGSPFSLRSDQNKSIKMDGNKYNLNEIKLLAPCLPSKIVCLGLNYRSHAAEFNLSIPNVPLIFLKPSTAVIGPNASIILPRSSKRVDYEGELCIVIGEKAKDVKEKEVNKYIFGYTCFNDVSERHNQKEDGQWTRAKGYDTFAPLGPGIETEMIPDDIKVETYVNGQLRQSARTSDLIFGIARIVSFISEVMTLLPGDIIATGTPAGIGRLNADDVVEIKIENIGTLRNNVISQSQ